MIINQSSNSQERPSIRPILLLHLDHLLHHLVACVVEGGVELEVVMIQLHCTLTPHSSNPQDHHSSR